MEAEKLISLQGKVLEGPLLIKPKVFGDSRGCFFESWNQRSWENALLSNGQVAKLFVQDNQSHSVKGVLRGLHYQSPPHPQGKLVRCVAGQIFDVAIDIRVNSMTFGYWVGAHLSSTNHHQLWIPEGFAHGFLTISDEADVLYKTTDFWFPDCERAIKWNDLELAIAWPDSGLNPILSVKDSEAPSLEDLDSGDLF